MFTARGAAVVLFLVVLVGFSALVTAPVSSMIEGQVTDDQGPMANAVVRLQGAAASTYTDSAGRFRLPLVGDFRALTAAKEGFLIAAGTSYRPNLRLQPTPTDDNDAYEWIEPTPNAAKPRQCGNCHQAIFDEWSPSAHGRSAKNSRFVQLFAGTVDASPPAKSWNVLHEHPLGSGVCAACHAPTLTSPELDYDVRQARGASRHGVHCDYCHKIAAAPIDKLGTRFGRDGYPLARPADDAQLFFGPLDDAVRPGEAFAYAPFYKESRYCASCHEGVIFGVHVYGTYSEWLESPARRQGKHCQDCHMAPTGTMTNIAPGHGGVQRDPRTLASHQFPGGTLEMLKSSLDVKVAVRQRGDDVQAIVAVKAHNVGHRVPTGFIDRHIILLVEAVDDRGETVPLLQGPLLPDRVGNAWTSRPGWIYGKQHLDLAGNPVPFWRTAAELCDTRLTPDETDVQRFIFSPAATHVRARLVYRRFWNEVARTRSWSDNDMVVFDAKVHCAAAAADPFSAR